MQFRHLQVGAVFHQFLIGGKLEQAEGMHDVKRIGSRRKTCHLVGCGADPLGVEGIVDVADQLRPGKWGAPRDLLYAVNKLIRN